MMIAEVVNMLINEIARKCSITKKAVQYYIEQGLVFPKIQENGYSDFSEEDAELLKQIALYRKLGLGISEIKRIIKSPEEISRILHQRTLELEQEKSKQELLKRIESGETLDALAPEIESIGSGSIIIKKLLDMFPGYYGKIISMNFSCYLTGEIETEEQLSAFHQIIDFFDNAPDIELPEDLQESLDGYSSLYSGTEGSEIIDRILEQRNTAFQDIETFAENNKEFITEYSKMRQTSEFKTSSAFRLMEYMKSFCTSSGYYDFFIPAMRKLSPEYDKYYNQMLKANKRFLEIFPDYSE